MLYSRDLIAILTVVLSIVGCESREHHPAVEIKEVGKSVPPMESFEALDYTAGTVVHHDASGRVIVKVDSAWTEDGLLIVRGEFTPDDPGFHLYSSELPRSGVNGVGRPTLLEVAGSALIQEIGRLISDKKPIEQIDELQNLHFPVYPDGPVTLYLPLRMRAASQARITIPVMLTYMSCSDSRCNFPVEAAQIEISVENPSLR